DAVFLNDGNGTFSLHQTVTITNGFTLRLSLGDVDGDGDLDAAVSQANGITKLLLNDGTGMFTLGQDLDDGINSNGAADFGDFDNDGDLDLLLSKSSEPNTLWLNDGNGNFTDSGQRLGSNITLGGGIGDLDGDGDLDYVSTNYNQANQVWLNENVSLPYAQDFENDTWQGLVINKPQNFSFVEVTGNTKFQADNSGLTGLSAAVIDSLTDLPSTFEMSIEMTGLSGADRWLDGFLIFDYKSPTDFKYAGMFIGQNEWVIGHYQGNFGNKVVNSTMQIDPDTEYLVHLRVEGSTAYLTVNNKRVVERTFSSPLNAGQAGFGSFNAVTCFDNFEIGAEVATGAPSDLPYMEDFEDGTADQIAYYGGQRWSIQDTFGNKNLFFGGGGNFGLGVAYLDNEFPLPETFEITADVTSYYAPGFFNDGFIVFDYQSPTDFKYVGMFVGQDIWFIGHYQGNFGNRIATASYELNSDQSYKMLVKIDGDTVSLSVDTFPIVSGTFTNGIGDGKVGFAGYNSRTAFDNIEIALNVQGGKPDTLPYFDDFEDREAQRLYFNNRPYWGFTTGETNKYMRANTSYLTDPNKYLALSYFPMDPTTAPSQIEAKAKISAKNGQSSEHNGYITFDYKNDTDFKYAGFNADTNQWVIGHYQGNFSNILAMVDWDDTSRTIDVNQFYDVEVLLNGSTASLTVDDEFIVSHDFGVALNQGGIGLATYHAFTWFDDFSITDVTPPPAPLYTPPVESVNFASSSESDSTSVTIDTTGNDSLGIELTGSTSSAFEFSVDLQTFDSPGDAQNGFVIFDYKNENDFKYAGLFAGHNQWLIGHYQGNWGNRLAQVDWDALSRTINAGQTYHLQVEVNGSDVLLTVDGEEILSASFADDVTTGSVGLAAENAHTEFSNLHLESLESNGISLDALFADWEQESNELLI
ncbi:MAG: VCBS repeat-containing protein, partial [Planctomycetaceae bacterium]|nr:VCBS repeat-containing protein [Planctomycetaceae bacterium]